MTKRNHVNALFTIGLLAIGGPVIADDGDVPHARILLEQARTYGVTDVSGRAAGQTETARNERRQDEREALDKNQERWEKILQSQSLN